ncbi:hypothetical protein B0H19DRAFT_1062897 [Mycena capillaripes]|nr:hypothetical protein B0H19DRAFT_1062897 [Mycena capillaripes]
MNISGDRIDWHDTRGTAGTDGFFVPKHRLQTGLAFGPFVRGHLENAINRIAFLKIFKRECSPKISLFWFPNTASSFYYFVSGPKNDIDVWHPKMKTCLDLVFLTQTAINPSGVEFGTDFGTRDTDIFAWESAVYQGINRNFLEGKMESKLFPNKPSFAVLNKRFQRHFWRHYRSLEMPNGHLSTVNWGINVSQTRWVKMTQELYKWS